MSVAREAFETLIEKMGHRVAPFDDDAAAQAADLMASRQRKGRPVELRDGMIGGIVVARHATLATRNLIHFEELSVPVVNPLACLTGLSASPACRAVQNREMTLGRT